MCARRKRSSRGPQETFGRSIGIPASTLRFKRRRPDGHGGGNCGLRIGVVFQLATAYSRCVGTVVPCSLGTDFDYLQTCMTHPCPPRPVEPLECRIAPSVFFLSGNSLAVSKGDGSSANDSAAATAVDASVAVLLHKGDSLVLDTNGNHAFDAGEIVYAKVTGGSAFFFAKDLNTSTSFGADEITGIAIGNRFKAAIQGDVNGSIPTLLDSDNVLSTTVLQNASLAGLTVSGRIIGDLRVGKNISNATGGAAATGTTFGVQNVLTGTAADDSSFSLNGGSTTITPAFAFE